MSFIQTVPPTAVPVDVRTAADNLGVDGTDSDGKIDSWLRGIVSTLEKRIGRCLMRQTWVGTLSGFPPAIELPYPVLRVVSIDYTDLSGQDQVLPLSAVRLLPQQYTTLMKPARGQIWPMTLADDDAVRITVECGYGEGPADAPADLRLYILAKLVEQFDPVTGTERETPRTSFIDNLLDPYRRYE